MHIFSDRHLNLKRSPVKPEMTERDKRFPVKPGMTERDYFLTNFHLQLSLCGL